MAGYLKIEGVDGESVDADHKDWINLLSVSQSLNRPMNFGASGSSRHTSSVNCGDVICVKEADKSTPKLIEAICLGKVFPTVKLDLVQSIGDTKRVPYMQWELKNVMVTDYSVGGETTSGSPPTESVSLNFEEIKWIYTQYGKDGAKKGSVPVTWKVEEGEAG
ncbi:MAG: type VI secretion system tube protein Hcp [Pirellulaceae bacterium]